MFAPPIDIALPVLPAAVLIDVDIDTAGTRRNINDGVIFMFIIVVVVAKTAGTVAEVDFRAGTAGGTGFHVLPAGRARTVAVAVTATVVVFMVDLGYDGAVREAATLDFKVVVGVLAAGAGAGGGGYRGYRDAGHGEAAIDIAMIDVVVDVVMLVFDYGLFDDGRGLADKGADTAGGGAMVLIDIGGCESTGEFTFA